MTGVALVREALAAAFPDAVLDVRDTTGTGDHVQARVVSASFEGRGTLDRHRMVYAALGRAFDGPLHALSLRTLTPAEASQEEAR